jgi:hypothetical protein
MPTVTISAGQTYVVTSGVTDSDDVIDPAGFENVAIGGDMMCVLL